MSWAATPISHVRLRQRHSLRNRNQVLSRTRRLRRPIGATLLFFCLIGLPIIWFSGALAVDFVRVLAAQRQASQMADTAAVAGAGQYLPNNPDNPYQESFQLDTQTARRVAMETLDEASDAGMGDQMTILSASALIEPAQGGSPATVTVTIDYEVKHLVMLGLADNLSTGSQIVQGTMVRSAFVCTPDANPELTFEGNCVKPSR